MCVLSILIPAYNQATGIRRILGKLTVPDGAEVEIIVGDDSTDGDAATEIEKACHATRNTLYVRNGVRRGAVANWNALIDLAHGEYALLLHHDEHPPDETFLPQLLTDLQSNRLDVLLLPCEVVRRTGLRPISHFPIALAALIATRCPAYYVRRNLLGPPSALVVRRSLYQRYDTGLVYLVDMDLYYRLLRRKPAVGISQHTKIISVLDDRNSISAQLKDQLGAIENADRERIAQKYGADPWIAALCGSSPLALCVQHLESFLWASFRCIERAFAHSRSAIASRAPRQIHLNCRR